MAQLMPLPLTVSCFSKIQAGFTFLVPAALSSPGKGPLNGCVCVCFSIQSHQNSVTSQMLKRLDHYLVVFVTFMNFLGGRYNTVGAF